MTEDNKKENYERAILALAVLYSDKLFLTDLSKLTKYDDLTDFQKQFLDAKLHENKSLLSKVYEEKRLPEEDLTKETAKIAKEDTDIVEVLTYGDEKVCSRCREWQNKYLSISGSNPNYPSLKQFINSGGLHINCRCSLHPVKEKEESDKNAQDYLRRKKERLESLNSESLNDIVFSGIYMALQ